MNKKILLVSNAYFPSIGGIENSLRHLAQEAINNNDEVKIIVSDIGVDIKSNNRFQETIDGIEVVRYPLKVFQSFFLRWMNLILSNYRCYKILRDEYKKCPDAIVIARFHFTAVLSYWAGFKGIRYLVPSVVANQLAVETEGNLIQSLKNKAKICFHNIVQKHALVKCKNFVFSRTMMKQCIDLAHNNIEHYKITKPGVDFNRFYPLPHEDKNKVRERLGLPIDVPIVLFVGRFVKAKGVELLIDALIRTNSQYHLVLVGEGVEVNNYQKQIELNNITANVTIASVTKQVEDYYQAADVFAMSSNYEPLGQTILEAFASGLPVIAFKRSDVVDTATQELDMDKYITYAENYNCDDLALAIDNIFLKLHLLSREECSNQAKSKFSWFQLYSVLIKE